ncbi:MAG: DUF1244 domain-containing protein [Lysobacteraceae bacterium]|nr:MAG: DUF1244 domain-containing protein [Xanthomonadaceae bacterium]
MTDIETELEAAAFRRLLQHLGLRADVQNIDLMITAGFCRNCLADWYREAAEARGVEIDKDTARERIYGEPFAQWKAKHQGDATPEQLEAFELAQEQQRRMLAAHANG